MKLKITRTHLWLVLIASILLAGMMGQPVATAADPTADMIENGMLATMKLWILGPDNKSIGGCSGTAVDASGLILTNFHCVGQTDLYGKDSSARKMKDGELFHPQGLLLVGPTLSPKQTPKPTYVAQFVVGNTHLDVAVIKIVSMFTQGQKLPDPLPLVLITRGDSDKVNVGDFVATVGYPGVGGPLVSYLTGQISGFDDQDGDGELDSLKTTANIAAGNSGGLGMNGQGEQIGISTWGISKNGEKIDRFKMINIAEPYIQRALQIKTVSGDSGVPTGPTPKPPSTTTTTKPTFGALQFGSDFQDGKLVGAGQTLPTGIKKIVGAFEFAAMRQGQDWGYVWTLDGQEVAGKSSGNAWKDDASGLFTVSLTNGGKALPDGAYQVTLYIGGAVASQGAVTVGKTTTPPVKQTPPPQTGGAGSVIKGQIVDADTQRGIFDALVLLLKPGVTIAEFDEALDSGDPDSLVAAQATTDQDGNYQTAPALARGKAYSVIIVAKGYQFRAFENGLEIKSDDAAVIKMNPVALQKR
ncbi:MAG: trypsin-like peptidase domain-containing protein [Chloroflexi bacterium]|nr:trypsin-like peptidase domain-containing protein [Chloroflexota bacterium]